MLLRVARTICVFMLHPLVGISGAMITRSMCDGACRSDTAAFLKNTGVALADEQGGHGALSRKKV